MHQLSDIYVVFQVRRVEMKVLILIPTQKHSVMSLEPTTSKQKFYS